MQRAGLLSEAQVAQAQAHAERHGGRFVDALLELELADEDAIVAFAHGKLMIPRAREALLERVGAEALARVPGELARRHDVLPVSIDGTGNLTLAMSDPTDVEAVEAVAEAAQAYVVRAVAPVQALRRAIERHHGAAAPSGAADERPAAARTWNPPMLDPSQEPIPLSPEALAAIHPQLVTATEADDVTRLLLDFLAAGFGRVILFVHSRSELRGKDCRGADLLPDAVRQVRIPSDGASLFSRTIASARPYFGPLVPDTSIDAMFAQALGGVVGNVLVLPLRLGAKVPLVVFAHKSRNPVDPRSIHELDQAVEIALSRIVALQKRRA